MTTTQTVEDILRPLVEATVMCLECQGTGERMFLGQSSYRNVSQGIGVVQCPLTVPDPRFEALRRPQDGPWVGHGGNTANYTFPSGIDASLGAIVRAAAACGVVVLRTVLSEVEDALREGAEPEEAAARALVVAWKGDKP